MLNKKYLLAFVFILFAAILHAQITTTPTIPVTNQALIIRFDSNNDSRLGYFTGDLYAHTGVGIDGGDNWQYVIGQWNNNNTQPKLAYKGNGIYELAITPTITEFYNVPSNQKIKNVSMVFRSTDGSKQTNDIFIDVSQPGLSVVISNISQYSVFGINENFSIQIHSSAEAVLSLFIDSVQIEQNTALQLETVYAFNQPGMHTLIASAQRNDTISADTIQVFVRSETVNEPLPQKAVKGISYPDNQSVRLVLWAPHKQHFFVLCDANNWLPDNNYQMKKDGDYFWIEIDELETGQEYAFQYFIDGEKRLADPYTNKILDPEHDSYISSQTYPNLLAYPYSKTTGIVSVFQPGKQQYTWQHPGVEIAPNEQLVIYELLVRDFSDEHSFAAVRQKLDYLESLHINVLELMPVNEFEGNIGWGYNPSFYFAPDKYYGPENELKKLIDECHQRNIAVVIDMVLNHSYDLCPFVQMYFENGNVTEQNPWYNTQSNFLNPDAQWGNDFNHDSEATKELIDSINNFWLSEFNVDGFRFDFTKGFSNTPYGLSSWGSAYDAERVSNLKRMATQIWTNHPNTLVIFEHLSDNNEETELANHGILLWGNMNYNYTEAAMGYNQNSDLSWGYYQNRNWDNPNLVTYQESHDEERIVYKCTQWGNESGSYNIQNLETAFKRIELNSVFHLPLPGPKMIWQFGELGYDYSIDYNGRLGEKPLPENYIEMHGRAKIFRVMASLNFLKQNYEEFSGNAVHLSLGGNIKQYVLKHEDHYVLAVGNFDVTAQSISVNMPVNGKWYNYFEQTSVDVTTQNIDIELDPGEYVLLSTREFDRPQFSIVLSENFKKSIQFRVFPNPVRADLIINGQQIQHVEIVDFEGRIVLSNQYVSTQNTLTLNVQNLAQGIYTLRINNTSNHKFLKL